MRLASIAGRCGLPLFALLAGCSSADHIDSPFQGDAVLESPELCDLGPKIESFASLDSMPKPIAEDFLSRLGRLGYEGRSLIAGRNQAFNWSDAITMGLPGRRFVQSGHLNDRWFIWHEQGGFAPFANVVGYQLDGTNIKLVPLGIITRVGFQDRPCELIVGFLNRR